MMVARGGAVPRGGFDAGDFLVARVARPQILLAVGTRDSKGLRNGKKKKKRTTKQFCINKTED
jgi:hypothetical protein